MFVQATVAILILVGFESVTSMGGEAKNAKRDVPIAVIVSLLVQGAFCYLFEYFAANYFLNSGYTMQSATGSAAPIGDMMIMVGDAIFGPGNGRTFMLIEAFTVFLALIGTTLSCMNTGARVTYAMGKDDEVPEHFGLLHSENLTPHRAIWTLAVISAVVGVIAVIDGVRRCRRSHGCRHQSLPQGFWSSFGYMTHDEMAALPNSLLTITLASNFGTFLLYMLSCITCIVAYHNHPKFNFLKHLVIPVFGLLANLACMAFYLIGPFMGYRHQDGTAAALWASRWSGHLRRNLFHAFQQDQGPNHAGGQAAVTDVQTRLTRLYPGRLHEALEPMPARAFSFRGAYACRRNFHCWIWSSRSSPIPAERRDHNEDYLGHVHSGSRPTRGAHARMAVRSGRRSRRPGAGEVASRAAVETLIAGFRAAPAGEAASALLPRSGPSRQHAQFTRPGQRTARAAPPWRPRWWLARSATIARWWRTWAIRAAT